MIELPYQNRITGTCSASYSVLLYFAVKRSCADAQQACRLAFVPVGIFQDFIDMSAFHVFQCRRIVGSCRRNVGPELYRQILRPQRIRQE